MRAAWLVFLGWVALLSMLLLGGCGETTTTDYCTFDSDCPETGDRFCVNGICRPVECIEDRDCDGELICVEGVCSDS